VWINQICILVFKTLVTIFIIKHLKSLERDLAIELDIIIIDIELYYFICPLL